MPLWIAGLASAIVIKLTSSIDDVVWLAPFLTTNVTYSSRVANTVIYISVCLVQTLVAMFIAYSGDSAVEWLLRNQKDAWSSEKILTVGAGSLLFLYSIKLTYEYCTEEGEDGEEGAKPSEDTEMKQYAQVSQSDNPADDNKNFLLCCAGNQKRASGSKEIDRPPEEGDEEEGGKGGDDKEKENGDKERVGSKGDPDKGRSPEQLFVIAFIGSVDDLTVFVPMLVGKAFDLAQLMLGAFIAAAVIVAMCICIGLCKPIADCLSHVPLALIVGVFAAVLLTKGFTME